MELIKTLEDTADSAIACGRHTIQVRVDSILAIAEAFRALEKRAEAAEALNSHLDLAVRKAEGVSESLRRRAEDAENENIRLNRESQNLSNQLGACDRERRDLRAKLTEMEKQDPYQIDNLEHFISFWRKFSEGEIKPGKNEVNNTLWLLESLGKTELFTRPAPAVSLAELVPDEIDNWKNSATEAMRSIGYAGSKQDFTVGANWMRAAILRNIEEVK